MKQDRDNGTPAFNPILRTKLHRPQLSGRLVNRDRLIKTMDRVQEVPLTLVSAPAGYGKSVLVAQWIEQLDNPIAWLSLDVSDSELRTFVEYFVATVDTVSPGACGTTRELLEAASLCPVPILASYLLNELDAIDGSCAIVLDDYHRIEPLSPVHDLMLRMLEHPPQQFRFIILTRQDPPFDLPSLRAGHRVNDVRLQDLRFTAPETGEFLRATTELSISDEALTKLEREVEGWAAGLRLVSLALRHIDEPDAYLTRLHGSLPQIQEYLLREVLSTQDAAVRDLLLASSILDRFCAEVLDAIREPPARDDHGGYTAVAFLDELRKYNLFTFSLDAHGKWFRYHHLFQELLENELRCVHGPDHVAALHLRASRWFEGEDLIDEALKHALAAEDMERSAELIARHRHAALDANEWWVLDNWLSLIPETVLRQRAELLLARAWILLNYLFLFEPVPALLDRAESLLGEDPREEELRGEVALCRGYLLWPMGDGAGSLRLMKAALKTIPVAHVDVRSTAEEILAVSTHMVGKKDEAIRFLLLYRRLNDLKMPIDGPLPPEAQRGAVLGSILREAGILRFGRAPGSTDERPEYVLILSGYSEEHQDLVREYLDLFGVEGQVVDGRKIVLPFGPSVDPDAEGTIYAETRSVLDWLRLAASMVEVPAPHREAGIVGPGGWPGLPENRLITVRSSKEKPNNAVVSVPFRGWWFYIDATDSRSKESFQLIKFMVELRLNPEGIQQQVPVLTIPVG